MNNFNEDSDDYNLLIPSENTNFLKQDLKDNFEVNFNKFFPENTTQSTDDLSDSNAICKESSCLLLEEGPESTTPQLNDDFYPHNGCEEGNDLFSLTQQQESTSQVITTTITKKPAPRRRKVKNCIPYEPMYVNKKDKLRDDGVRKKIKVYVLHKYVKQILDLFLIILFPCLNKRFAKLDQNLMKNISIKSNEKLLKQTIQTIFSGKNATVKGKTIDENLNKDLTIFSEKNTTVKGKTPHDILNKYLMEKLFSEAEVKKQNDIKEFLSKTFENVYWEYLNDPDGYILNKKEIEKKMNKSYVEVYEDIAKNKYVQYFNHTKNNVRNSPTNKKRNQTQDKNGLLGRKRGSRN